MSHETNFSESYIINPFLTKLVWSRWLVVGLVFFFFFFFASLRISTPSRSMNTQKKSSNLANIQPSRPHTWSITHTYCLMHVLVWSTQAESVLSILTLNDLWNASKVLCMILYFIPRDITRVTVESRAL